MKNEGTNRNKKLTITTTLMLAIAGGLMLTQCKTNDVTPVNNSPYIVTGSANGTQLVPAVPGTGTGDIRGAYYPGTHQLSYTSQWNRLTGAPTSGGFYIGGSGEKGTAVGVAWTLGASPSATGSTSGTLTLTDAQAAELTSSGWYFGYGTAANSTGEVRGQISAIR